jgi:FixJ family two-component response regulator
MLQEALLWLPAREVLKAAYSILVGEERQCIVTTFAAVVNLMNHDEKLELLDHFKANAQELSSDTLESHAQLEALIEEAKALQAAAPARTAIIHVVDDDEPFSIAICRLLRASGYTVRSYASAGDFLMANVPDTAGCILMDVCLPGPSGLELQAALANRPVSLPVIFLSGHADVPTSVRAMKGGAIDFLTKPVDREALLSAVQNAIARSMHNRALREQLREQRERYERLTKRETEVFERVVAGKMNKEIAGELGAAERTIKAHRAQVMQKMRVSSVAELVHIADQLTASQARARF